MWQWDSESTWWKWRWRKVEIGTLRRKKGPEKEGSVELERKLRVAQRGYGIGWRLSPVSADSTVEKVDKGLPRFGGISKRWDGVW